MDPTSEARNIAKEQYTNVRRSLADFEERVIASRWDEDTLVRAGFDRFLGSLDRIADWLFAEGGQPEGHQPEGERSEGESDQPKSESHEEPEPTHDAAEQAHDAAEEPDTVARAEQAEPDELDTAEQAHDEADPGVEQTSTEQPGEESAQVQDEARESDATAQAQADEPDAAEQAQPDEPDPAEQALVVTVGVVFALPADIEATSVALCGEFNDWSEDDIFLSRDTDGTWRTIVALEPGRSYRYRFLIDGERWENARQADDYVPNPFGTVDSVVIVGQRSEN